MASARPKRAAAVAAMDKMHEKPAKTQPAAAPATTRGTKRKAADDEPVTKTKKSKAATETKPKAPVKKAASKVEKKKPAPKKPAAAPKAKAEPKPKAEPEPKPKTAPKTQKSAAKAAVATNTRPDEKLNVYMFGEGTSSELGLGTAKIATDVKRPRLNANLSAQNVGIVQIATGGMHCIALAHDGQIYTWGVNDNGALGRDTKWEGGTVDMDAADKEDEDEDSDDEDADTGMNPRESVPTAIPADSLPAGTKFVKVAAGDSCSFALTTDGQVYGWGSFRDTNGTFGFYKSTDTNTKIQQKPIHIEELEQITDIACGANHALALDSKGHVWAWGSGEQYQLGRQINKRNQNSGLIPRLVPTLDNKKVKLIAAGEYHCFAVDDKDDVYAWGLNNYAETGIKSKKGYEKSSIITRPEKVAALSKQGITTMKGGSHHSIAVTQEGKCLVWGRLDGKQMGIPISDLPSERVVSHEGRPRILEVPTAIESLPPIAYATAGSDHSIAITKSGQAYSWGFGANYQLGLGEAEDVEIPTLIENTAVRGKKLVWAGAGGQFSVIAGPAEVKDVEMTDV